MLEQADIDAMRASVLFMYESKESAAAHFYATLFQVSPELRSLFPVQMKGQAAKFTATLNVAVNALDDWPSLRPVIETLAWRHLAYGVTADHYPLVGTALIQTLRSLGASPDELETWKHAYGALAQHMITTAYPDAASATRF